MSTPPAKYTGVNGFYASIQPIDEGLGVGMSQIQAIVKQVSGLPLKDPRVAEPDDLGFHCTIMYSKTPLRCSPAQAQDIVQGMKGPTLVTAKSFDYWDGHDQEGYLVLKLDAPDLVRWHKVWHSLGAVSTFEDYQPHITLVTGPQARELAKLGVQLTASLVSRRRVAIVLGDSKINDLKG